MCVIISPSFLANTIKNTNWNYASNGHRTGAIFDTIAIGLVTSADKDVGRILMSALHQ